MPDDPAGSQAAIRRARTGLLTGRGPGAGPIEIATHTWARTVLGDQPVTRQRAILAQRTAFARGDTDAIAKQLATAREQLAATLTAIRRKAHPDQATAILRLTVTATAVGFVVGIGAGRVLRRHQDR